MKCVIIVNDSLPPGLAANTSAVLAASLSRRIDNMVGEDVVDGDGEVHRGITRLPIPILQGDGLVLKSLRRNLAEAEAPEEVYFVDFCDVAQQSLDYGHYRKRLRQVPANELSYLGLGLCGPAKRVNALTGQLSLLR